jgi:predicted TIM-barrel fold metal-dependent hydrolase
MIVDSQVHLWGPETPERPYVVGGSGKPHLPEPLTYTRMLGLMDESGVDRVIIVPPSWAANEGNDHALEAATTFPDRFGVMGRIAVEDPASKPLLPKWREQKGMLGIRLPFNHERIPWLTDGTVEWFWPAAEAAGVPVMLFAPDAPEVTTRLGRDYPGLKLIIDHMGLATYGPEHKRIKERLDLIVPLAKHANIAIKLSAIPDFSAEPYPFRDMTIHLKRLVDAFGPERCFWGTDMSHSRGRVTYPQYVSHFAGLDFLSDADRRMIMGDAILRYLGWP